MSRQTSRSRNKAGIPLFAIHPAGAAPLEAGCAGDAFPMRRLASYW
jgi:hypothetical protein